MFYRMMLKDMRSAWLHTHLQGALKGRPTQGLTDSLPYKMSEINSGVT